MIIYHLQRYDFAVNYQAFCRKNCRDTRQLFIQFGFDLVKHRYISYLKKEAPRGSYIQDTTEYVSGYD